MPELELDHPTVRGAAGFQGLLVGLGSAAFGTGEAEEDRRDGQHDADESRREQCEDSGGQQEYAETGFAEECAETLEPSVEARSISAWPSVSVMSGSLSPKGAPERPKVNRRG